MIFQALTKVNGYKDVILQLPHILQEERRELSVAPSRTTHYIYNIADFITSETDTYT